jgi:transcriptional regulator
MYLPKHFEAKDPSAAMRLMQSAPLATLVTMTPAGLTANLIPLEYVADEGPHGTLRGHVARANPVWREADPAHQVLAVFRGADAYVSPSGYASKREHGKVVPTWNYEVVQARGSLRIVDDAIWLRALVNRLTDHHEHKQQAPWSVNDAPGAYIEQMLRAIVGLEIQVSSMVAKVKASQNRSVADRAGVAAALDAAGSSMAERMAALIRSSG